MNTALTAGGAVTVPPRRQETIFQRMSRRGRAALGAWSRRAEQRYSREELAELHERRQEASRLRDETFRNVAVTRLG